jgi:hypothetical protein
LNREKSFCPLSQEMTVRITGSETHLDAIGLGPFGVARKEEVRFMILEGLAHNNSVSVPANDSAVVNSPNRDPQFATNLRPSGAPGKWGSYFDGLPSAQIDTK